MTAIRDYRAHTAIDEPRARILAARVLARRDEEPRGWRWVPLAALAAAGFAFAALRDRPAVVPIPHVQMAMDGTGTVDGTERAPRIRWESGRIGVQVDPGHGVHLAVETPEAAVTVVGTAFTVDRAHHASRVEVSHGVVRVRCVGQAEEAIGAGEVRVCVPADPALLLVRVAELFDAGAPPADRLAAADDALARLEAGSPLRPELLAHRTRALADAGQTDAAAASAEDYLATGERTRRAELLAFVAQARFSRDGCAARPALEQAAAELPPGPEWLQLASCLTDAEPARARALVEGASAWATGEWAAVAGELRQRLGGR